MYHVFPSLILRAAAVRSQCLELSGLGDYYASSSAPSSSTLVAAAPSVTNVYTLAFGEREGLAPGERLEVYGNTVRLVRTLAYGCPRGVTPESAFTGRLESHELSAITEQLEVLAAKTKDAHRGDSHGAAYSTGASSWKLRIPPVATSSQALRQTLPSGPRACTDESLAAQLTALRHSEEEVVVAEWIRPVKDTAQRISSQDNSSHGIPVIPEAQLWPDRIPAAGAEASSRAAPRSSSKGSFSESEADGVLLTENGVCFRNADRCGLRALRTTRLAFISSIERTANGLARRQHSRSGEETRRLTVLDANAIDFTFSQAALQSALELGLHTEGSCHISFVPLTHTAAALVEAHTASHIQVVAAGPGKALPNPFRYLSTYSVDVGAYTARLPLPTADGDNATATMQHLRRSNIDPKGQSHRQQLVMQLSQALATLRRGACMLVTFVPTCSSAAALYHQMETQRRAEVLMEHRVVKEAKACIAEAIARTGRWGFITEEVLPAVDSAQGSSFSLVVMLQ